MSFIWILGLEEWDLLPSLPCSQVWTCMGLILTGCMRKWCVQLSACALKKRSWPTVPFLLLPLARMPGSWTTILDNKTQLREKRTEQIAKVPTMTSQDLCNLTLHRLSGLSSHWLPIDHSTVVTLTPSLFPMNHRAFALAENAFPRYPHGSLSYSLHYFIQIFPFQWDMLWLPCQNFNRSTSPNSSYLNPCFTFLHSPYHYIICCMLLFIIFNCLVAPTRISPWWGQEFLLFCICKASNNAWNIADDSWICVE